MSQTNKPGYIVNPYRREDCPTPEKLVFQDKSTAKRKAKNLSRYSQKPYKCVCGRYHLATKQGAK